MCPELCDAWGMVGRPIARTNCRYQLVVARLPRKPDGKRKEIACPTRVILRMDGYSLVSLRCSVRILLEWPQAIGHEETTAASASRSPSPSPAGERQAFSGPITLPICPIKASEVVHDHGIRTGWTLMHGKACITGCRGNHNTRDPLTARVQQIPAAVRLLPSHHQRQKYPLLC